MFSGGCNMYKDLHTLCPLPYVRPLAFPPDFLGPRLSFFSLPDPQPDVYISSNFQLFFFPHKVVHREDFSLPPSFKTTPKAIHFQLIPTYRASPSIKLSSGFSTPASGLPIWPQAQPEERALVQLWWMTSGLPAHAVCLKPNRVCASFFMVRGSRCANLSFISERISCHDPHCRYRNIFQKWMVPESLKYLTPHFLELMFPLKVSSVATFCSSHQST